MGNWFPNVYDVAMLPLERIKFSKIRKALVSQATGRVLEIGSGTGVNFPIYQHEHVSQVDAIEPNLLMNRKSKKRIRSSCIPIQLYLIKAERLPFVDNTFDSVVATLVFCTIPIPSKAIKEILRVSKPGAKILLFEHVRMNQEFLGKTQDLLTPFWKRICDGCYLNRNTLAMLRNSEVSIHKVDRHFKGLFLAIESSNKKI